MLLDQLKKALDHTSAIHHQSLADIAMALGINSSKAIQFTGQNFATYLQQPTDNGQGILLHRSIELFDRGHK
jgi:hypothetical protein